MQCMGARGEVDFPVSLVSLITTEVPHTTDLCRPVFSSYTNSDRLRVFSRCKGHKVVDRSFTVQTV